MNVGPSENDPRIYILQDKYDKNSVSPLIQLLVRTFKKKKIDRQQTK